MIRAQTTRSVLDGEYSMKCVKSLGVYSPQNFVEKLTGCCYGFDKDNTVEEIHILLKKHGIETDESPLFDYPLDEIEEIVANEVPVVLVDTTYIDDDYQMVYEYRWFEVPENFVDEE